MDNTRQLLIELPQILRFLAVAALITFLAIAGLEYLLGLEGVRVLSIQITHEGIFLLSLSSALLVLVLYNEILTTVGRYFRTLPLKATQVDLLVCMAVISLIYLADSHITHLVFESSRIPLPTWQNPILRYVIPIALAIFVLRYIAQILSNACLTKCSENVPGGYFLEEPIEKIEDDVLGRSSYAERIADEIVSFPEGTRFVFAIYGAWGEGKTSVLNLVERNLEGRKSILLVRYRPWYFEGERNLLVNFFKELEEVFNTHYFFPNLSKLLSKYSKILVAFIKEKATLDLSNVLKRDSIEDARDRIQEILLSIPKKVVITIDDIDRLDTNELLAVLKLVKLTANFKNLVYLLSFDEGVVTKKLRGEFDSDKNFLDKIVQKPFNLAKPSQRLLDEYLESGIQAIFKEVGVTKEEDAAIEKDFGTFYQSALSKLFSNLRNIKKYLNLLRASVPHLRNEVNLSDILVLEAIRLMSQKVYEDMWRNPWYYTHGEWDNDMYLKSPRFLYVTREHEFPKALKSHIDDLLSGEPKQNQDIILRSLKQLFFTVKEAYDGGQIHGHGDGRSYRVEKRVSHPAPFRKYFMGQTPETEIPDAYIEEVLETWSRSNEKKPLMRTEFNSMHDAGKLRELLEKLRIFSIKADGATRRQLVEFLYENALEFNDESGQLWSSDYYAAETLIEHLLENSVENNDIRPLIDNLIEYSPRIELATQLVEHISKGVHYRISNHYPADNVRIGLKNRLYRDYVYEKKDIVSETRYWTYVLRQWALMGPDERLAVNEYFFSLVTQNPEYLGELIDGYIVKSDGSSKQIRYDELIEIYDETRLRSATSQFNETLAKKYPEALKLFDVVYLQRHPPPVPNENHEVLPSTKF